MRTTSDGSVATTQAPPTSKAAPPSPKGPKLRVRARDPEALDEVVRVTSRRSWMALAAIGAAVLLTLVWATVARIPQQTTVAGVVRSGNNVTVVAPAEGSVVELPVVPGDEVKEGDPVAVVRPFDGGKDIEVPAIDGGVVREAYVDLGDGVTPGQALMVVRPLGTASADRRVVIYVSPLVARDFRPGRAVDVQIPDVSSGTDQQLAAEVERVAAVRTSKKGIAAEVESADLAESLFEDADGSPYRVDIKLHGSAEASVGSEVFDGQVVEVVMTYDNPHPIQLLFGG